MKLAHINHSLGLLASIALLVFGVLILEAYWILGLKDVGKKSAGQNLVQQQANEREKGEIQGLKVSQIKISAMFVRLNDAVFNLRPNEINRGAAGARANERSNEEEGRPAAIQLLTDAGVIIQPGRSAGGESSLVFEAGSSRLELERLIALFAEEENSNAFLYFDRLILSRPATTRPFSIDPTYLDARFSIRVLSTK